MPDRLCCALRKADFCIKYEGIAYACAKYTMESAVKSAVDNIVKNTWVQLCLGVFFGAHLPPQYGSLVQKHRFLAKTPVDLDVNGCTDHFPVLHERRNNLSP
jgi:hypothetical protein